MYFDDRLLLVGAVYKGGGKRGHDRLPRSPEDLTDLQGGEVGMQTASRGTVCTYL